MTLQRAVAVDAVWIVTSGEVGSEGAVFVEAVFLSETAALDFYRTHDFGRPYQCVEEWGIGESIGSEGGTPMKSLWGWRDDLIVIGSFLIALAAIGWLAWRLVGVFAAAR